MRGGSGGGAARWLAGRTVMIRFEEFATIMSVTWIKVKMMVMIYFNMDNNLYFYVQLQVVLY